MAASKKRKKKKAPPRTAARKARQNNELEPRKNDELAPVKAESMTAVVDQALATGIAPYPKIEEEIPGEEKITGGDPDVDTLRNEYSGEEFPGGDTPTPDQSNVDEIGRAYGLTDEDSGALKTSEELLKRRDRKRQELKAPKRPSQL